MGIFLKRNDNLIGQAEAGASSTIRERRYVCSAVRKWIIPVVLWIAAITAAPSVLRPCHAAEDVDALMAAMSEHLVCYPLELMSLKKQQLSVASKDLCLASVYHHTGLHPLWVTPEGPGPKASIILSFLSKAETEGLDPKNYEVEQISALFAARQPQALARLDTLLTFNLIKYVHDVSQGQIKPRQTDPALFAEAGDANFDPLPTIQKALSVPDLAGYLASLPPAHQHYTNLKRALMLYRTVEKEGGWPSIGAGKTIRPGDQDDRIPAITRRLFVTGDLAPKIDPQPYYDPLLEKSVKRFQIRHGLTPDGAIGTETLAAMNVPASGAIKQIIINMTRWRWQEHDLGEKYILVNIAHFDLTAFDNRQEAFSFPVIVGKLQHQTPVFSDRILYIEINPFWNIPPSIARNEQLPKLRKDPRYLAKQHVRLFSSWSADAREIDSTSVDWKNVSPARMGRYKLRQDPGPWNALGQVKFVFPNKYDVYLHDTPTQNLFSRTKRDFSHGCIRVSDPAGLAAFVLTDAANSWTPEDIEGIIKGGERVVKRLPEPLPVHITYQTAWVDKNGIIYFNRDVYGRDKKLRKALFNE